MSRAAIADLETPYPLAPLLPSLLQGDDFVTRLCAGLDEVLAPILWVLDNFESYLDPALAPDDFVAWLASWVGVDPDAGAGTEPRQAIAGAVSGYRWRGTVEGIADAVQAAFGRRPVVEDSGGTVASMAPVDALPGADEPMLVVRLALDDPSPDDARRLDVLVAQVKPANLPHHSEIVTT